MSTEAPPEVSAAADDLAARPGARPARSWSGASVIAVVAGLVALVGAVLLPIAPVSMSVPEVRWPADPAGPGADDAHAHRLRAGGHRGPLQLPGRPGRGGDARRGGPVDDGPGVAGRRRGGADRPGARRRGDRPQRRRGPLRGSAARRRLPRSSSAGDAAGDVRRRRRRDRVDHPEPHARARPGRAAGVGAGPRADRRAARGGCAADLAAGAPGRHRRRPLGPDDGRRRLRPLPRAPQVGAHRDDPRGAGVGAVAMAVASTRRVRADRRPADDGGPRPVALTRRGDGARRLRPRVVDALVPAMLLAWLFLAPITDDDGYYSAMAANVPFSGYVANYYQLYNQGFTPFSWPYYALSWWQETFGVGADGAAPPRARPRARHVVPGPGVRGAHPPARGGHASGPVGPRGGASRRGGGVPGLVAALQHGRAAGAGRRVLRGRRRSSPSPRGSSGAGRAARARGGPRPPG